MTEIFVCFSRIKSVFLSSPFVGGRVAIAASVGGVLIDTTPFAKQFKRMLTLNLTQNFLKHKLRNYFYFLAN